MADDKIIDFEAKKAESAGQSKKTENIGGGVPKTPTKISMIKDGKVVEQDVKKVDVNATIDVTNPEVDELIDKFTAEKTNENLTALIKRLEMARVLVPAKLIEVPGKSDKMPVPLTVNTTEGEIIQPIFTDKVKMAKAPKCEVIMNLPFVVILATVLDKGPDIAGIGINPFNKTVVLKRELLEKIMEVVKKKSQALEAARASGAIPAGVEAESVISKEGTVSTKLKLTEEQYVLFERSRFEVGYLPTRFYKEGQSLIDAISDGRESYIDNLFEDSYTEKRMYPYLPNEFKVMFMGVSEALDIAAITMPTRDVGPGIAETIYMAWNKESNTGRYFAIVSGKKKNTREVVEVNSDIKPNFLGEAPAEGTEISWIVDMVTGSNEG